MIAGDRHIALVGLMGSGKSTVGERLARRLRRPFADVDAAVVARHGSIPKIFEREGESGFRAREAEAFAAILAGPPAVVATGGGLPTHPPSRELLATTLQVHLAVPHEILVRRLAGSTSPRPLLGARPTRERIEELWRERRALYEGADVSVDADDDVETVVESIVIEIEQFLDRRRTARG